jgi:pimeloyl-ACP methyl ester carboxylesterase
LSVLAVAELQPVGVHRATVVALPGLAESAECLAATARHWAGRGLRVLAIDPRGHGASPRWSPELLQKHPGDIIVDDIVETLEQFLTEADDRLVLFGHSAGGGSAAAVAAALRARVVAVVLEDPFWRLPVTPFQAREVAIAAAANLRRLKAMSDVERQTEMATIFPTWPEDEFAAWSSSKEQMDITVVENGNIIPSRPWPILLRDLSEAGIPVLVVTGSIRIGMTPNHRAIIRSLGADVAVLEGTTHFVRRDTREAFHALVDRFVDAKLHAAVPAQKPVSD